MLVAVLSGGCGGDPPALGPQLTAACSFPGDPPACVATESTPTDEGHSHAPLCSPLTHGTNPPATGAHYIRWPTFRSYERPIPWGYLLHAMEHGAVVIAHNCGTGGCPSELEAARALLGCVAPKACGRPPVILVPDPKLDVRFAAAAWGHLLKASCFDPPTFARFIEAHGNRGPESFPNDCGLVDLEATGWCEM